MYTSAQCRAYAEAKLTQAEHDDKHRKRLIAAAEAWLILASQMRRTEGSSSDQGAQKELRRGGSSPAFEAIVLATQM